MIVKNHHKDNAPVYLFAIIVLLLVIYFLTACYPARRAARQVAKAAVTYPEQTARQLRLIWPLDTTIRDTTIIEGDHAGYDAAIESLGNEITSLNAIQDSLINALAADTNCAEYAKSLQKTKDKTRDIAKKIPSIPKVTDTARITGSVKDRSDIAACEAERNKALDLAAKAQLNADVWHKTAKQRGYVMWSALGLILLFVVYKVIRLIK